MLEVEAPQNQSAADLARQEETVSLEVPLHDPDFYLGDPNPAYRRLRQEAPVYRHEQRGWWALSRYEDIRWVSINPEIFSSAQGIMIPEGGHEVTPEQIDSLIFTDPPRHRKLRNLIKASFMPSSLRKLEPRLRQIAGEIVYGFEEGRVFDYTDRVAAPMPTLVVAQLLGTPAEDWDQFRRWSDAIIGFLDPEEEMDPAEAHAAMHVYLTELIAARRREPRDDLTSVLVRAEIDGASLTDHELYSFCWLLVVAGNETIRNLVSLGTLALIRHPEQLRALQDRPELIPRAVEEMLRWCGSVTHMARTVTRDVELRGQKLRAGEKVVMLYAAANRDEQVFGDDAEEFVVTRHPNPHLTFGFGEHACLGANMARLQVRTLFAALLPWLPRLELAGEVARVRATMVPGVSRMPVRIREQ
ncbi:MAG: cytochrome P450 [Deltaproteobacteria bacterium]|nr:cytochrome P450 [Deltaproteobacteria bacterium]